MDYKDTWEGKRRAWNEDGKCSREACKMPLGKEHYRYPTNGLLYCKPCSWLLQEHQPGLVMEAVTVEEQK